MPKTAKPDADPVSAFRRLYDDPVLFVRAILHAEPTGQQRAILTAMAQPGAHVAVRSGHGVGKTSVMAWALLWWLITRVDCRIPCTAPSGHQLYDLLWAELDKWAGKMLPEYRACLEILSERASVKEEPMQRFAVARTARPEKPEALQGFHATNLLYLIDEASGIDDKIFQVAEGSLSSRDSRVLMASNPTRRSGYFYEAFTKSRASWQTLNLSCAGSPLVDPAYVTSMRDKYGINSNVYRVRVLGDFPASDDDVLIPLDLIEAALVRTEADTEGQRIAGCDPGRFGADPTAFVIRQGGRILHMEQWQGKSITETAGIVAERHARGLFDSLRVDVIGLGAGVADCLRDLRRFTVMDFNCALPATDGRCMRLRDQFWFKLREWLSEEGTVLPAEHALIDDLVAEMSGITYRFTAGGRLQVESKDDMKARLERSPNLADALCMTFADSSLFGVGGNTGAM